MEIQMQHIIFSCMFTFIPNLKQKKPRIYQKRIIIKKRYHSKAVVVLPTKNNTLGVRDAYGTPPTFHLPWHLEWVVEQPQSLIVFTLSHLLHRHIFYCWSKVAGMRFGPLRLPLSAQCVQQKGCSVLSQLHHRNKASLKSNWAVW